MRSPQTVAGRYVPATYDVIVGSTVVGKLKPVSPSNGHDYRHQLVDHQNKLVRGWVATRGLGRRGLDAMARNLYAQIKKLS